MYCTTKYVFLEKLLEKFVLQIFTPSFLIFCAHIGQLFAGQWVIKHSEEFRNRRHFPSITVCWFSNIIQIFTVPRVIDQFVRVRCQNKRKDAGYKLLKEFFQKYFVVHEQSALKNSFITNVCMLWTGCFILNSIVFFTDLWRYTAPRIIDPFAFGRIWTNLDEFGRKRYQKKRYLMEQVRSDQAFLSIQIPYTVPVNMYVHATYFCLLSIPIMTNRTQIVTRWT